MTSLLSYTKDELITLVVVLKKGSDTITSNCKNKCHECEAYNPCQLVHRIIRELEDIINEK